MENQFSVPYPEARAFGKTDEPVDIRTIGEIAPYVFDHAEYPESGGILVFKKELLYPTKGFVFPQAVQCINVAKRMLIDSLVFLVKHKVIATGLLLLPFKRKIKLLDDAITVYNRAISKVIDPIAPLYQYQIDISQELWRIIETFLTELGVSKENATEFAKIFATCINYDNAYHLRLVDLFSETNKEKMLVNPVREFKKLAKINFDREIDQINLPWKINYITWILRIAFLSARVRLAFKKAIAQCNFKRMQYDKIWRYNVLERGDYRFMGLEYPERMEILTVLHDFKPPRRHF